MVLTSAQLASYLETLEYPIPLKVMDSPQPLRLRKFPSIEIDNVTPRDDTEDYQINKTRQQFDIHVYMRIKAGATEETATLQQIEDLIRTTLDGVQLAGSKIILQTATWTRTPVQQPVYFYDSRLTVSAIDESAVTGILGLQQTVDLPGLTGLQLFGETGGEGRESTRRSDDSGSTKVNKGQYVATKYWEYPYTKTNFDIIQALIVADNEITATLHEGGTSRAMTVKPVFQEYTVRYDGQKVVTLRIEIVSG